jgi:hypothetical protein
MGRRRCASKMAMRLDLARLPTDPVLLQRGVRELALTRYTDDGRLEIDHNRAENTLRGVALGRKNWLFAGSDTGGDRAAAIYSLIETCKLASIDPFAYLRDILGRSADHKMNRIDELLPCNWAPAADVAAAARPSKAHAKPSRAVTGRLRGTTIYDQVSRAMPGGPSRSANGRIGITQDGGRS